MASKYHLLINLYKILLLFQLFCKDFINKLVRLRSVSASLSLWLLCWTLLGHFTVFVKCCRQICFRIIFVQILYIRLYFLPSRLFPWPFYRYNTWFTMLHFYTVVSKDPYFLVYFWMCLLETIRLWRHHNDVIYKQLRTDVTSKEKLGLYCCPLTFCPNLNDTRGLRIFRAL